MKPSLHILLFLSGILSVALSSAQDLTDIEKRGQHIYRTGTTPEDEAIPTFLAGSETLLPSHLFACANCHGQDGKGVPEGGAKPSNITWHNLTKAYGAVTDTHRAVSYTHLTLPTIYSV